MPKQVMQNPPAFLKTDHGGLFFIPSLNKFRSSKRNPPPLRGEDFVEVGGGFEPPYPVLQTDA